MKIDRNIQIPNMIVYVAAYAVVFGVSIWLLVFHKDTAGWFPYMAMIWSAVAGLAKFAFHSLRRPQRSV